MNKITPTVSSALKWSAIEQISTQGVGFVISITLARQLGPIAYGLIGMIVIFTTLSGVIVNSGFNNALIRKLNRTEKDFSTVFYFSFVISIVLYVILFYLAPYVSTFYKEPALTSIIRVISLALIIDSLSIIPRTKLTIKMDFKSQMLVTLVRLSIVSCVTLYLAFNGYGVWTLVVQTVLGGVISTIMLFIVSPWRPKYKFSLESFKELFGFSSKLLIAGVIDTIYNNLYYIFIGKNFDTKQLGFFTQANTLASAPTTIITWTVMRVTYPLISALQYDTKEFENSYAITLKMTVALVFPVMIGISIVSEPLFLLMLGDAWTAATKYISILCFGLMLQPIHALNANALQALGKSNLFLKLDLVKKLLAVGILFLMLPFGVLYVCIGIAIHFYLGLFICTYYTGKLTSLGLIKQLKLIAPMYLMSIVSGATAYQIKHTGIEGIYLIVSTLLCALIMYLILLAIYQNEIFNKALSIIKNK